MKQFGYRIIVEWSAEDECYVARVPALPGCAAHGSSPELATKEVRIAAQGILESMKKHREKLPTQDVVADYSGQLRLRLPRSLHAKLSQLASSEGVSLNQQLVALLTAGSSFGAIRAKSK